MRPGDVRWVQQTLVERRLANGCRSAPGFIGFAHAAHLGNVAVGSGDHQGAGALGLCRIDIVVVVRTEVHPLNRVDATQHIAQRLRHRGRGLLDLQRNRHVWKGGEYLLQRGDANGLVDRLAGPARAEIGCLQLVPCEVVDVAGRVGVARDVPIVMGHHHAIGCHPEVGVQ